MPDAAPFAAFSAGRSSRIQAPSPGIASFVAIVSPLTHFIGSMRGHATRMPTRKNAVTPLWHRRRFCGGRGHPHASPLLRSRARPGADNFEVSYSFKSGRHGPLSERNESPCYERNFGLALGSRWVKSRADSEPVSSRGAEQCHGLEPAASSRWLLNKHPPLRARLSLLTPNRCCAVDVSTSIDEVR